MKLGILIMVCLLLAACANRGIRCAGRGQSVNPPAAVVAVESSR